jgi:hypothetical protein
VVPAASLRSGLFKRTTGAKHLSKLKLYRATASRVIARLVSSAPLSQREDDDGRPAKLIRCDIGQERFPILSPPFDPIVAVPGPGLVLRAAVTGPIPTADHRFTVSKSVERLLEQDRPVQARPRCAGDFFDGKQMLKDASNARTKFFDRLQLAH